MNPDLRNQIVLGLVGGLLVAGIIFAFLGGKREELNGLQTEIQTLEKEVAAGKQYEANYLALSAEVKRIQARIDELVQIMPTDTDAAELPFRIKKFADSAGIDQLKFQVESAVKQEYYTARPYRFTFRGGMQTFGQFASLLSGHEKLIAISDLKFERNSTPKSAYAATINCKVSAFVYNVEEKAKNPESADKKPGNPS